MPCMQTAKLTVNRNISILYCDKLWFPQKKSEVVQNPP